MLLDTTEQWVRRLAKVGEIRGVKVGRDVWELDRTSVIGYGEQRRRGRGDGSSTAAGRPKARTVAAVPSPPSLAAEARRAAEGPARRVGDLESALKDALDRKDYTVAQGLNDELAEARQESAIAAAAVTGLQAAIAEIEAR